MRRLGQADDTAQETDATFYLLAIKKISAPIYKMLYKEERSIRNMMGRSSSEGRLPHNVLSSHLFTPGRKPRSGVGGGEGTVWQHQAPSDWRSPSKKVPTRNICQRPTEMARLFRILFVSGKLCPSHDIP